MPSKVLSKLSAWSPLCGAEVLDFGVRTLSVVFFDDTRSGTVFVDSTPWLLLFFFCSAFFFLMASRDARESSCKTVCYVKNVSNFGLLNRFLSRAY